MPLLALPFLGSLGLSFFGSFLGEKAASSAEAEKTRRWGMIIAAALIALAVFAYFYWIKK